MLARRLIADIKVGARHRKDLGDLAALAKSIAAEGLLQPIGIDAAGELVFGERRLCACRDHLGWTEIDVRVVPVSSIAAGEYAENEMRKDFTPSERVAILDTIKRLKSGRPGQNPAPVRGLKAAAKSVGFVSDRTAQYAISAVRNGIPELVDAMDRGVIGIRPAAELARLPASEQRSEILSLPATRSKPLDGGERAPAARNRKLNGKLRSLTIPYSAVQAARILTERWPPSLCRELIEAIEARLKVKAA